MGACPFPTLTAVPLIRAILAVPDPITPLPVGNALVQLLALELEAAAAPRERRGRGCHVGSCTHRQTGRKAPRHGRAGTATSRDRLLSPGPDSTRWQCPSIQQVEGMTPQPSSLLTAEGWKSLCWAGNVLLWGTVPAAGQEGDQEGDPSSRGHFTPTA